MKTATIIALTMALAPYGIGTIAAQDTLRVDVRLVNIVATVTDADGLYVQGLQLEDFVIEDDGVEQTIAHFSEDRSVPVSLGIVLDTSASMVERMRTALAALSRFIDTLHESDEIFVTTFANRVSTLEEPTSDRDKLYQALLDVDVAGGTALYDAVVDSVERAQQGHYSKRAVVVLTDGSDTQSTTGLADALEIVRRSEVLVYGLGIDALQFADDADHVRFDWPLTPIPGLRGLHAPTWTDEPVDLRVLDSFARASGGRAFLVSGTWSAGSEDDIQAVLDEVAGELRSQYSLGYYPTNGPDGRLHEVRVRVRGENYTVRSRSAYRSPAP